MCEGERRANRLALLLGLSPWRIKADTHVTVSKGDRQKGSTLFYNPKFFHTLFFPPLPTQNFLQFQNQNMPLEVLVYQLPHSTCRIAATQTVTVVCLRPGTSKCQDNNRNWVPCVFFLFAILGAPNISPEHQAFIVLGNETSTDTCANT